MPQNIHRLLRVMARLRHPETGCAWDKEQTFATIAPYTIEEAYEVADAVEKADREALREELGDLLLQVVFHSRMAEEEGAFDFDAVAGTIADKLIHRHPNVFGDVEVATAADQTRRWEEQKAAERAAAAQAQGRRVGALEGVIAGLPALTRALKLQKRAARVGFDWVEPVDILDKLEEEIGELRAEMKGGAGASRARVAEEMGDLLFVLVNLARRLEVDPEDALRGTNAKFERRFRHIEDTLAAAGRTPGEATLDEMEALWQQAKTLERKTP